MTSPRVPPERVADTARALLWLTGLIVGLGAAAATAHGLYEVAVAARVPRAIAWLYPLITDGLAMVAYGASARLSGGAARYAWAVVVLAAGLSGLAQAAFLAADTTPAGAVVAAPAVLRFAIGAWPAIAAAVVAHLLYLLATDHPAPRADPATAVPGVEAGGVHPDPVQRADTVQSAVFSPPAGQPALPAPGPAPVQPADGKSARVGGRPGGRPAREAARRAAARHAQHHGALPTVTELQKLADVSRGTAQAALRDLRAEPGDHPTGLHLIHNQATNSASAADKTAEPPQERTHR